MDKGISELQGYIDEFENIVFFGGAGVSTESGIPDFRSKDGIYNLKYSEDPETIISRDYFFKKTEKFYDFYRDRMLYPDAKPNKAHLKLAELERFGRLKAVVTQNIDSLHTDAGSKNVFELHGSVKRNTCLECNKKYTAEYILSSEGVPRCSCGGIIKPDVVLYGEQLDGDVVSGAIDAIAHADLLIIAGTSLAVYPAAGFLGYFSGEKIVLINRSPTPADSMADLVIRGNVGEIMGQIAVR